jgi:hypothetical protein
VDWQRFAEPAGSRLQNFAKVETNLGGYDRVVGLKAIPECRSLSPAPMSEMVTVLVVVMPLVVMVRADRSSKQIINTFEDNCEFSAVNAKEYLGGIQYLSTHVITQNMLSTSRST